MQADSIVPQPGNPQSLNRYAYTLNNPLRYVDVTGHYPQEVHYHLTRLWVYNAMVAQGTALGHDPVFVHNTATAIALQVAEANQAVDEDASDSSLFGHTLHWYSHAQAREVGKDAIAAADPQQFGRASHAIQDYYTHFGSGFTGYTEQDGVNDFRRRLTTEDRYTLKSVELDSLPVQQLTLRGRLVQASGVPLSRSWGHAGLYSDEYSAYDPVDNAMRREYETYARQFATSWWKRLTPVKSQDERRISR